MELIPANVCVCVFRYLAEQETVTDLSYKHYYRGYIFRTRLDLRLTSEIHSSLIKCYTNMENRWGNHSRTSDDG